MCGRFNRQSIDFPLCYRTPPDGLTKEYDGIVRRDGLEQAGREPVHVSIRTCSGDGTEEFQKLGRADDGVGDAGGLERKAKKKTPSPADAATLAYPALSWTEDDSVITLGKRSNGRIKVVSVEPSNAISDPSKVAGLALAAAERGAKVLVVRNLVRDAVATARAVHVLPGTDTALFRLDGVPTLHHGRFARVDRRRLDDAVEREIGQERPAGPLVLIGTQTLKQSLDIDADLLITDLAPMDVLLQRIGRLHRHDRDC